MSWINSQPWLFQPCRLIIAWVDWQKALFSPSPPQLVCGERSDTKWQPCFTQVGSTHWWWLRWVPPPSLEAHWVSRKVLYKCNDLSIYVPCFPGNHIVDVRLREAVEGGGGGDGVGPHVVKQQPFSFLQFRQLKVLQNEVVPITGLAEDGARVGALIWLAFLQQDRNNTQIQPDTASG